MKKTDILARLRDLPWDPKEYWVVTGGAMVLHGLREQTHDVDLGCTAALADALEARGFPCERLADGTRHIRLSDDMEAYENWLYDAVVSVEGVPVLSLCGLLEMKRALGREKDARDVELILDRLSAKLRNAYFINGSAYAGKSTLVHRLAEKHGGVECGENYHDALLPGLDPKQFPCLCWSRDLQDWHEFIRRAPEDYEAWIDGVTKECEALELRLLTDLCGQGRPVFVDTNISLGTLRRIAAPGHVLILLADPEISVRRFFERPDREKQFLYRLILEEPDPDAALENYRRGLTRINSRARYEAFLHSGFPVLLRDEGRSPEQTLALAEELFGLTKKSGVGAERAAAAESEDEA